MRRTEFSIFVSRLIAVARQSSSFFERGLSSSLQSFSAGCPADGLIPLVMISA